MVEEKENLRERLNFYGLEHQSSDYDRVHSLLSKHADNALDAFYARLMANPETSSFFNSQTAIDRAHGAQKSHWMEMFSDGLNDNYLNRAIGIGNTHARIGLEPKWYIGGYATILEFLIEQAITSGSAKFIPGQRKRANLVATMVKVALLDMDLALSTYFVKAEENVRLTVVNKIGKALEEISRGDLTAQISGLPRDYAKLEQDFNAAMEKLRETIASVASGANSITTGAAEIRSASDDLSHRTEEQAAQLEESAAAMDRLTGAITDTSKSISGLNGSVSVTHQEALKGAEVVHAAMQAMDGIQKSSDSIAEIIKIIDGIAFQTNLLALNAGVEAARVGDLGKGFAVVANEVRALAQRSSEAAEQVKQLIGESMEQVENGVRQVHDTGKVLEVILQQMSGISEVAGQITQSTESQSNNLLQINRNVSEMDKVTQQNAAMVEEATAAARAMAGEAERLADMVAQFSTGDASAAATAATPKQKRTHQTKGNLAIAPEPQDWSGF